MRFYAIKIYRYLQTGQRAPDAPVLDPKILEDPAREEYTCRYSSTPFPRLICIENIQAIGMEVAGIAV